MANNTIFTNTPKGIGADGVADFPSAYKIVKLQCENQNGDKFDISRIVTSFTITEELFSPIIVLNLKIRDTINFFEDFSINGQEKIEIELERDTSKEKKKSSIKLKFSVKEYPNYQKTASEPNVQEYNVIAISEFGYNSMLTRISRSVKGNPVDNITKIFRDDLNVSVDKQSSCVSTFDGIITIQSPLKAIEWLRSKSFDSNGAPFFVFSTISNSKVVIQCLTDMWASSNSIFKTYEYRQFLYNKVGAPDFYTENATRVLDMRSNIKLDKLTQASKGGFASKTNVTDIANKTFSEIVFDYSSDATVSNNRIDTKSLFSSNKSLTIGSKSSGGKSLSDLADASISQVASNSLANYQGNQNSSSGPVKDNISRAKSYYANLEGVSHQIQVYGDFKLNPGKKIRIKIPKAVDAGTYENTSTSTLDESMSGDYIIAVASHSFSNGIYTSKLKIIKDS